MPFALRAAVPADLELLVRHRQRMWEDMGTIRPGADDPSKEAYRAWLRRHLGHDLEGWIAVDGNQVLGSGLLWSQEWHPRPAVPRGTIPYLVSVFVEPTARRQGVARAITQAAIDAARAAGHPRMALHASDEGRPLYESLGFAPSKEFWLELGKA
jgi:GNAT superfamily N-acetyltransferase